MGTVGLVTCERARRSQGQQGGARGRRGGREIGRTDPRRAVADDDVGVAEAVLVLCDEVAACVDADDEGAERVVAVDERVEEGLAAAGDPPRAGDALELLDGEL